MKHTHQLRETPTERLKRVASYCLPYVRTVSKRNYLIGIALLLMIVALLTIAFLGGSGAARLIGAQAKLIHDVALPFWR